MSKNLVIVESPAKAKTIKKFLGPNYTIEASMGHIRDLPKSQLGVDIENDFEPKYITIRGKGDLLAKLKKEAKKANKVYLATDPDREGEAISWHLLQALQADKEKCARITFNEITKTAVKNSIKEAREINMSLVDAQQARRILDRIVGYKISPLLWKKVKKGLSAGRVQSVALKLICDREKEIQDFIPEAYWTIDARLREQGKKDAFDAKFQGTLEEKVKLETEEQVKKILQDMEGQPFTILSVKDSIRSKQPPLPFTTSSMQQEAAKKLNFTTSKTMRVAQQLYEGVDVAGHGTVGLITYLRTDSTRISQEAHENVLEYIGQTYGQEYPNAEVQTDKKKGGVQDAHEAIRPTYVELAPKDIKDSLDRDQLKLYTLLWNRFVASRMQKARYETKSVKIGCAGYLFTSSLTRLQFDGFLKVYDIEDEEGHAQYIDLSDDASLEMLKVDPKEHFTQPPPRFTEASLVKALEENGVGRPSTYAPTISTILSRGYVAKEKKQLFPTELGEVVDSILISYFGDIVEIGFTAQLEAKLDTVEEGLLEWKEVIRDFYPGFDALVEKAQLEVDKIEIKDEETDIPCEKCGRNMVIKMGKYGKFLACPGFPECMNAKPLFEKVDDVACPKCGGAVMIKKTKKGRRYYGCENNPECDFMTWDKPTDIQCPQCGSMMVEKGKKHMCINPECKHVMERQPSE
ncbi:type I DNA topoisomerase [Anaerotalea alkaliphila]|uniref:DNA topoisomerase 1 n=1 Tax=Anaerotalea alkaliphila TaxID=2662126 RepID=A0A7X5KLY0_9FIRM|nr:type I DNA topoisomerase [Anaerotalea alkaliphila]NDL66153.1 type I DNA topoisomerase [Anaerotalea alkaliphila]